MNSFSERGPFMWKIKPSTETITGAIHLPRKNTTDEEFPNTFTDLSENISI